MAVGYIDRKESIARDISKGLFTWIDFPAVSPWSPSNPIKNEASYAMTKHFRY